MREVIWDCETTGLSRTDDHIVEFGAVEMVDGKLTGRSLHLYVRAPKPMPREAEKIHGLSDSFLADKPVFAEVVDQILDFIEGAVLVAHNGDSFDVPMLNAELKRLGRPPITNRTVDTMPMSRKRRPGKKHNLDAICRDYGIDLRRRTKHGALLDAQLLAEAYVELSGGRQGALFATVAKTASETTSDKPPELPAVPGVERFVRSRLTASEYIDHLAFVATLKDAIWREYYLDVGGGELDEGEVHGLPGGVEDEGVAVLGDVEGLEWAVADGELEPLG